MYGGYCGVVTPRFSYVYFRYKTKVPKADDLYGFNPPNVTNGAPWGAGAFPPTPANTCTPTLPSSGTWAGYVRVPSYGYNSLLVGVTGSYGHDAAPDSSTWNEVTNIGWVTGSDTTGNLDFGCRDYPLMVSLVERESASAFELARPRANFSHLGELWKHGSLCVQNA